MTSRWFELAERLAPWFAGFLLAVPVVLVRYPPVGDLAMHEASVSILRHLGDPAWSPPGLYYAAMPQANQLFCSLAYALSWVFPTDLACKIVVALAILIVPPAAARLLRRLGASPWLALLLGPVACGWTFRKGLVANLIGFALLLVALPSVERLVNRPSTRRVVECGLLGALLFFAHESSAALYGAMLGLFSVLRQRNLRRLAYALSPGLVLVVLALAQGMVSRRLAGPYMQAIGSYFGWSIPERVLLLPGGVFGGLGRARLVVVGAVAVGALVASVLPPRNPWRGPLRVSLWRRRYLLGAAAFLTLYFTFPMGLGGSTLLAYRFLPGACACLVVACAQRAASIPVVALAVAAPLAMLGAEARDFAKAEVSYRALDRIIALVPMNAAIAQLDFTPRGPGALVPVPGAPGRVLAERGGRMLFAWTDTPPNPIYVPRGLQWNESVARLAPQAYALLPSFDFRRYSYLVARCEAPSLYGLIARALAPEAELVTVEGEWALFRSRLPTVPITAADEVPADTRDTLASRVNRMLADSERPLAR